VPAEVQQRIELEKALLDKKGRERDLQNLEAEAGSRRALTGPSSSLCASSGTVRRTGCRARGHDREDEPQGAAGRDRGLSSELARREEEGRGLGVVGEVVLAIPDLAEMKGDGFRGRGRRRPGEGGAAGHGPSRGPLGLRPPGQGRAHRPHRQAAVLAHAAQGLSGGDRAREDRPTFMRPAMRFRGEVETGRVPACCSSRATRSSCATPGRSCGRDAPSAGAR